MLLRREAGAEHGFRLGDVAEDILVAVERLFREPDAAPAVIGVIRLDRYEALGLEPLQDAADRGVGQAELPDEIAGCKQPVAVAGEIAEQPALGRGQLHVLHVRVAPAVESVADALDPRGKGGFTIHHVPSPFCKLFSLLNNNTDREK